MMIQFFQLLLFCGVGGRVEEQDEPVKKKAITMLQTS